MGSPNLDLVRSIFAAWVRGAIAATPHAIGQNSERLLLDGLPGFHYEPFGGGVCALARVLLVAVAVAQTPTELTEAVLRVGSKIVRLVARTLRDPADVGALRVRYGQHSAHSAGFRGPLCATATARSDSAGLDLGALAFRPFRSSARLSPGRSLGAQCSSRTPAALHDRRRRPRDRRPARRLRNQPACWLNLNLRSQ